MPATAQKDEASGSAARTRIQDVLSGKEPDRLPVALWLHNFVTEQTVEGLVAETLRLQAAFDFDIVKPQSPAMAVNSLWGLRETASQSADEWPETLHHPVSRPEDLARIGDRDVTGRLADQIEVISRLRAALGGDRPILATAFSPMMNLWLMHEGGRPATLELMRSHPKELSRALDAISAVVETYVRMALAAGADGVFYATTTCNRGELTRHEHELFHAPYDASIQQAAEPGWLNVLHLCGPAIEAEWFADAPAQIINWEVGPNNPSLRDMHNLTGKVVMGGLPGKPGFGQRSAAELAAGVQAARSEMSGRNLIIGPGCSVNPGIDERLISATVEAVREVTHEEQS